LRQQRIALDELGRAHPGNGGGHIEHVVRHLAHHQVGLVGRGTGDQHVGVLGAGLAQHRGLDAIAHHAAQVQPFFQRAQARRVLVDDGDVVLLRHQALGHAFADAPGAQNDDVHEVDATAAAERTWLLAERDAWDYNPR